MVTNEDRDAIERIIPGNEIEVLRILSRHVDVQLTGQRDDPGTSAWKRVAGNLHDSWIELTALRARRPQ